LPVAANVDERRGLEVLHQFETSSLNPKFFHYPSLYYYLTYFAIRPFTGLDGFLLYGRILNVIFACGLGASAFLLTRQMFKSPGAGLLAAGYTMFSPVILFNGSYVITDILAAMLCLLGVYFWSRFFERGDTRSWVLGGVMAGLAVSTKYTAGILVAAYLLVEFIHPWLAISEPAPTDGLGRFLARRFSSAIPPVSLFLAGVILMAFVWFFPKDFIFSLIREHSSVNASLTARELAFLEALPRKCFYLGLAVVCLAAILYGFRNFSERLCLYRPYVGLGIALVVFLVGSPFVLVSWKMFAYEFGAELKNNMASGEGRQWLTYVFVYYFWESLTAGVFFVIGVVLALRQRRLIGLAGLYAVLLYVSMGSATRWYERYLTPLLPVMFAFSGWGIWCVGQWLGANRPIGRNLFVLAVVIISGAELYPKITRVIRWTDRPDETYQSYMHISVLHPARIYFLGRAPYMELRMRGFAVEEVAERRLIDPKSDFWAKLGQDDILLIDGDVRKDVREVIGRRLSLAWRTDWKHGQYVYRMAKPGSDTSH